MAVAMDEFLTRRVRGRWSGRGPAGTVYGTW
jgi:hypothetical protein